MWIRELERVGFLELHFSISQLDLWTPASFLLSRLTGHRSQIHNSLLPSMPPLHVQRSCCIKPLVTRLQKTQGFVSQFLFVVPFPVSFLFNLCSFQLRHSIKVNLEMNLIWMRKNCKLDMLYPISHFFKNKLYNYFLINRMFFINLLSFKNCTFPAPSSNTFFPSKPSSKLIKSCMFCHKVFLGQAAFELHMQSL